MNRERIGKIIDDIELFTGKAEAMKIKTIDDLKDERNFYSLSMILLTILNRAIDLGDQILIEKKLGFPGRYKEIFKLLYEGRIIDEDVKKILVKLVHSRNLLAHEYQTFTRKDVFQIYQKLGAIKKFVDAIKKAVR